MRDICITGTNTIFSYIYKTNILLQKEIMNMAATTIIQKLISASKIFSPIGLIKFIRYRYFSKHVVHTGMGGLIISGKTVLRFSKGATLNLHNLLHLNYNVPRGSRKETIIQMGKNSTFNVRGPYSIWYGGDIKIFDNATLTLGSGYCNINCMIRCNQEITLGDHVFIAHNVTIMDSDFHHIESPEHVMTKPVHILDNVWIGNGATILKGVTIGEGSIVAAKSVVTHDVPPRSIVAGNPARVIKENISWRG